MLKGYFITTYGNLYPAVSQSTLADLVFAEPPTLSGQEFHGTLLLEESFLGLLASMLKTKTLAVGGTVSDGGGVLTVAFGLADDAAARAGLAEWIPLLKPPMLAKLDVTQHTVILSAAQSPDTDDMTVTAHLRLGKASAALTMPVPQDPLDMKMSVRVSGTTIALEDLQDLLGDVANWYPRDTVTPILGPSPKLELLSLGLIFSETTLQNFKLSLGAIDVTLGASAIPLIDKRLYLDPLSVRVITSVPPSGAPIIGLGGLLKLCRHQSPGDFGHPSVTLELSLSVPDLAIGADLENPGNTPLAEVIRDLIDQDIPLGLPDSLTLTRIRLDAQFDKAKHNISAFSATLGMSAGFGGLAALDLERIELGLSYAA